MYTRRQRSIAALYGIACHLAFITAVGTMMWKLYCGLKGGPDLPFAFALAWNFLLILQFPVFHSLLLTPAGSRFLSRCTPGGIGSELRTTTFALIASLQILLTFLLWAPLGPVLTEFHGINRIIGTGIYAASWVLLLKSMSDAGLGVQMGYLGWWAVFQNRKPQYKPFKEKGVLRASRHPMYLAYTLLLWTGPIWSIDHILLAGCWTFYCLLAPLHKESRYRKRYGDTFNEYQKRVPYMLPPPLSTHQIQNTMNPLANARHALTEPDLKRSYNRTLFEEVAPRYDLITRVLSLGRDTTWKKWMIQKLPADNIQKILDLACGTGDITRAMAERYPEAEVIGLDLTPEMLSIARKKSSPDLTYIEGDMMQTQRDSESFDLITGGYALRNAPDLQAALSEIHRLLRPGAHAAFLDFSAPVNPHFRKLHFGLLWFWGALWGLIFHGNPRVYAYIARSLAQFPDRKKFRQQLMDHHLIEIDHKQFMLGMIEVIICKKN